MKKTRKKNYKKGARNELIRHILSVGLVTSNGLTVMEKDRVTYQRSLTRMKKEGLLGNAYIGRGCKAAYIQELNNKGDEYLSQLPPGYYRHYNMFCSNISKRLKDGAREDRTKKERVVRMGDAFSYMRGAGVRCYWDEKPDIIKDNMWQEKPVGSYYTSMEIKDMSAYSALTKGGVLPASRSVGILCGEDRCYPVFMTENKLLKWTSITEEYFSSYLKKKEEQWGYETSEDREGCIMLATDEDVIVRMMFPDTERLKNVLPTLFTREQSVYDKIYALPYTKNSQHLICKMTEHDWEEQIKEAILGQYYKPKTNVTCDAIVDGTHIFVFCIPNIMRFARFIMTARDVVDAAKFIVYCYSWQENLVRRLLNPDECTIEVVKEDA